MGRTLKDRHDLDEDDVILDEPFEDEELDELLEGIQHMHPPAKKVRKKRRGRKRTRHDNFPTDIKDWRDPEDDIMFGFKE